MLQDIQGSHHRYDICRSDGGMDTIWMKGKERLQSRLWDGHLCFVSQKIVNPNSGGGGFLYMDGNINSMKRTQCSL